LKKVKEKEENNKMKKSNQTVISANERRKKYGIKSNGEQDRNHIVHYEGNTNFEPIVTDKEPWVLGDYQRNSFCLHQNKNGSETETIQLIKSF
jgi:hypothetical protein